MPLRRPTASSSGRSWSNTTSPSLAVDLEPEPVLAPGRHLAHDHRAERAGLGLEQDEGDVLGLDGATRDRRRRWRGEGGAAGGGPLGHDGRDVARAPGRCGGRMTNSTRSHQCEPMSAKARDRAADVGVDPPAVVVGGRSASPAGSCRAAGGPDRGRLRRPCARACRTVGWKRYTNGTATTRPAATAAVLDACGAGGVDRQRLLAHDVLAGCEGGDGQRLVEVVRRADVDDVDVVGDGEGLGGGLGPLGAERSAARWPDSGSRRGDGDEPGAGEPGRRGRGPGR